MVPLAVSIETSAVLPAPSAGGWLFGQPDRAPAAAAEGLADPAPKPNGLSTSTNATAATAIAASPIQIGVIDRRGPGWTARPGRTRGSVVRVVVLCPAGPVLVGRRADPRRRRVTSDAPRFVVRSRCRLQCGGE